MQMYFVNVLQNMKKQSNKTNVHTNLLVSDKLILFDYPGANAFVILCEELAKVANHKGADDEV